MQDFINYLQQKDFTTTTQNRYCKDVVYFLDWFSGELINCSKKNILDYLTYLQDVRHNTNHSRNCALNSLKHYFNFLASPLGGGLEGAANPTHLIKLRGTKKKQLYKIFTTEALEQLYDNYYHHFLRNHICKNTFANTEQRSLLSKQRNYIMLGFLVYQGLCTNEVTNLKIDDIDLQKSIVKITGSKRSNERALPIQVPQIGSLINYIENVRLQFKPTTEQLFLPLQEYDSSPNKKDTCKNALQKLALQLKIIEANFLNFNRLRASVITHWLQIYGLRKTQYLAGHRYISSTEYYAANELQSLTNDITQYNPF
jgi:site-specific recombinase XerD